MEKKGFRPYVPAEQTMPEFTFRALLVGVVLAIILGAANAYVGMKAGLTVAATFPATVMALALLRPFGGTVLEQNIARTTASVGEALVAGAIFTIPAFLLTGVWSEFNYGESTLIMLVGGTLGVLFVIFLRRVMVHDPELPFPESVACAELTKAGQAGETGARYVFGAMGLSGFIELFKNDIGIKLIQEYSRGFIAFKKFPSPVAEGIQHGGGIVWVTPSASPMLMGVGFIIGWRLAALVFTGGVLAWGVLVPLLLFAGPHLETVAPTRSWMDLASTIWRQQVRPLAVGAMIVAAFYTLSRLSRSLGSAFGHAVTDLARILRGAHTVDTSVVARTEKDLPMGLVLLSIIGSAIPIGILYGYFTRSVGGTIVTTLVMIVAGLLFAAVAGYLVGVIGSSNNPISGLTLSTLIIAALVLLAMGITGERGILAVLGVAAVICCAMGIAGDMMQDLKIGHLLGGTPWRMELGEMVGVWISSLALTVPLIVLHKTYTIGSEALPAPQAGLMALMSKGIVAGEMAWPLVLIGALLAVALILLRVPSVMLIAVGMYLPFYSTAAIFVGGLFKAILDRWLARRQIAAEQKESIENVGILVASGLIAGESITSIILAFLYMGGITLPRPEVASSLMVVLALAVFLVTALVLMVPPLRALRRRP
jgi:putative OPT family oligopeptide transporter